MLRVARLKHRASEVQTDLRCGRGVLVRSWPRPTQGGSLGRFRQEHRTAVRRVWGEDRARRPGLGMELREHLVRVRVRGAAYALEPAGPPGGGRAGRATPQLASNGKPR